MGPDEHRKKAEEFIRPVEAECPTDREFQSDLNNALYAFSELGLWKMDIDIKRAEEAVRVWALVESVRRKGFPSDLGM